MGNDKNSVKPIDCIDWLERNVSLDYGMFSRDRHPWAIEPIRSCCDTVGRPVVIHGSNQFFKTLASQLALIYGAVNRPCRAAFYAETSDALGRFREEKFEPLVRRTKALVDLVPSHPKQHRYHIQRDRINHGYGTILLLSANTESHRNAITLRRAHLDEPWLYAPGYIAEIETRLTEYARHGLEQFVLTSSGGTFGDYLYQIYMKSNKRTASWRCPSCGKVSPVRWSFGLDGAGNKRPGGLIFDPVSYEFPCCGHRVPYSHRNLIDLNEFALEDEFGGYYPLSFLGDDNVFSDTVSLPKADADWYNYNALLYIPWPKLIDQWRQAQTAKKKGNLEYLETFIRKRLGEFWRLSEWEQSGIVKDNAGTYILGEIPEEGDDYRVMTVDVQQDHYYYVVRTWSKKSSTVILDRGIVMSSASLSDVATQWGIPTFLSSSSSRVFLDGNYNTSEVRKVASQYGFIVFRGEKVDKGYQHGSVRRIYGPAATRDAWEGTLSGGTRNVIEIPYSETDARNRLATLRNLPGSVWTYDRKPDEADAQKSWQNYVRQINTWQRVIQKNAKDNSESWRWQCVDSYGDHYFDCEKMQIVAAALLKIFGD